MMRWPLALLAVVLLLSAGSAHADWWDDLTAGLHAKLVDGADFIRDKASPVIREKFDDAKQTLQDPETHKAVRGWLREKAFPYIAEKFAGFKEFVNEEVMPQVQRVYEAGAEAAKSEKQRVSKREEHKRRRRRRR